MAGGGSSKSSNATPRVRKRVEAGGDADTANAVTNASTAQLKRARDGSAFARCEGCNKDVPVALISMHSCSFDAQIRKNLESQVVLKAPEVKKTAVEKKEKKSTVSLAKKGKKVKNAKDANMPKRPPTAFFLFLHDFRKTLKETNPNCKKGSAVAKEGGEKWKSMTDEEKKVYNDRVAEFKAEYEKALEALKDAEGEAGAEVEDVSVSEDDDGGSSDKEAVVETISDDE